MIRVVALDIDGVITDGKVWVNERGEETKSINFRDIDAIFRIKRSGRKLALITGEDGALAEFFNRRFKPDYFYSGAKDKRLCLEEIAKSEKINAEAICFVGDSLHDVSALKFAGLSVCPRNSMEEAKKVADRILRLDGGNGSLMELAEMIDGHEGAGGFDLVIGQHIELIKTIASDDEVKGVVEAAARLVSDAIANGKKILICGNGGSAADAQHIAAEFVGKFYRVRRPLPAQALSVNTSTLTAIGNDFDFDTIFQRQVEALGNKGDVLLGISTSGASKNVLRAMDAARKIGMKTIFLTGAKNKKAVAECDIKIAVPSADTPRIQEAHIMIAHYICAYVEQTVTPE